MNKLFIGMVKEYSRKEEDFNGFFTVYLNTDEHNEEEMVKGVSNCLKSSGYINPYVDYKHIQEINTDYSFPDGKKFKLEYFKFLRSFIYFNKRRGRWELKNFPYPYLSILNLIMKNKQYNIFWIGKNEKTEIIKEIGKHLYFTENIEVTYFSEDAFKNDIDSLIEIFRIEYNKDKHYSLMFANSVPLYYMNEIVKKLQVLNKDHKTPSCYYYADEEFKSDGRVLSLTKDSRNKMLCCEETILFI